MVIIVAFHIVYWCPSKGYLALPALNAIKVQGSPFRVSFVSPTLPGLYF
jgi:hypothetical protein